MTATPDDGLVTVRVQGFPEVAGAVEQLRAVLDEADELCRSGHMLVLATPPDLAR